MALVNRGTRAIAIVGIDLTLVQAREGGDDVCMNSSATAEGTLKERPVVVEVNRIVMVDQVLANVKLSPSTDFNFDVRPMDLYGCVSLESVGLANYTGLEITDGAFFASYRYGDKNTAEPHKPNEAELLEFRGATRRVINHTLTIFD